MQNKKINVELTIEEWRIVLDAINQTPTVNITVASKLIELIQKIQGQIKQKENELLGQAKKTN